VIRRSSDAHLINLRHRASVCSGAWTAPARLATRCSRTEWEANEIVEHPAELQLIVSHLRSRGQRLKFIITANGPVSYQTASPEQALERARTLISEGAQHVVVTDMNGREYGAQAFDECFVRTQSQILRRH
jgi:hypothetical protein